VEHQKVCLTNRPTFEMVPRRLIRARVDIVVESQRIGNSSVDRAAFGVEYSDHLDLRAGAWGGASALKAGVAVFGFVVVVFSFV